MPDELPADQRRPGFPFLPIALAGAGSALAAVLLSRLGLVGTVIGAALTPIIIITVQELAQRPIERVAEVGKTQLGGGPTPVLRRLRPWERVRWRRVVVLGALAFGLTVVAFTVVESVLDRPIATDDPGGAFRTKVGSEDSPPADTGPAVDEDDEGEEAPTATTEAGTTVSTPDTTGETDPGTTESTSTDGATAPPEETGTTTPEPGTAPTAPEATATDPAPVDPAAPTTPTTATTTAP